VKDRGDPFGNLETTGITSEELMEKEILLKQELLAESKLYGGRILLHSEGKPTAEEIEIAKAKGHPAMGGVYAFWEPVIEVLCVHEHYRRLERQYPELKFMRLPITDEQEPEEKDFDQLADALKGMNSNWSVICNCQMGRGRTTTAMVFTSLVWSRVSGGYKDPKAQKCSNDVVIDLGTELAKKLSNGEAASGWADNCIVQCAQLQDLKAATVKRLKSLSKTSKPKELKMASHYVERYLLIVLVAAYLLEDVSTNFQSWMRSKRETGVYEILEKAYKFDLK
jgi:hypothetical protein